MTSGKLLNLDQKNLLTQVIHKVGLLLPSQGPISNFAHLNILQQFEEHSFFDGIEMAAKLYSASSYLSEQRYQDEYNKGRISQADLNKVLGDDKIDGKTWLFGLSKRKFYRSLLLSSPPPLTPETLRWRLIEKRQLFEYLPSISLAKKNRLLNEDKTNLSFSLFETAAPYLEAPDQDWENQWTREILSIFSNQDVTLLRSKWKESNSIELLWAFCCHLVSQMGTKIASSLYEESSFQTSLSEENKLESTEVEELINPYLIKFTSGFLDAGLAHLSVADREQGLFRAFISHMKFGTIFRPPWFTSDYFDFENKSSLDVISEMLASKRIPEDSWNDFILQKALILKGWGGLIYRTETGASGLSSKVSLADFLAIRFILEENAEKFLARNLSENKTLESLLGQKTYSLQSSMNDCKTKSLAYHLFSAFQIFGVSASQLLLLDKEGRLELENVIKDFTSSRRLRIWQRAFEWNLHSRAISSIVAINSKSRIHSRPPKCQIVCCIDDREESFRRHIEELSDEYQTFGTAGFFGVDAKFHSLYERAAPYCPINVVPTHHIHVVAQPGSEQKIAGLGRLKQIQSEFGVLLESQSRSLVRGWLLAIGGILALFPLSIATFSPRLTHKIKNYLKKTLINPQEESALVYAQNESTDNDNHGFTLEEMAFRVRTLLTTSGLIKELAPLIVIIGHGSFSMNNPYRSAYDCGACGGRPGRLNPRAFASMANRKDVRKFLRSKDFEIPESVYFLGAFHNTCTEEVEYFDKTIVPSSHQKIFERVKIDLETARARNALERCRRFDEVKITSESQAIAHVESRAHHIAQPRPEYGHATNALCIIGRRQHTRNLFLDRRAFLVSYDKTIDLDGFSLRNLLRATVPVCMGINLDYFFSTVDNQKYGAGTKLSHNVTSLLGLMTGYCSDLRTGLPTQMIEIHEPTRLLITIDLEPELILAILGLEPEIFNLIKNRWVLLSAYDSDQNQVYFFTEENKFELITEMTLAPPEVKSSLAWIFGKKEHLDFVEISH